MFNSKTYDYIIVCKRPDFKLVDGISQLMLFLSLIVFTSDLSSGESTQTLILHYTIIGIMIGWWVYGYYRQKKGSPVFFRLALLAAAVGWSQQAGWSYVAVVFFIAAILEKQVKFPLEIAFDDEEIIINSLPKKYYNWPELANVVIRDGILTIDFKNNKLIQKEIEDHASSKTELEFNAFCRERLLTERGILEAGTI